MIPKEGVQSTPTTRSRHSVRKNPLNATTYLVRNLGKSLPLAAVIILAVLLIAGIVSLINSITLSIRTIYSNSRHFAAVTPRGNAELTPFLKSEIETKAPVKVDRIMLLRSTDIEVKSIVGPWPFAITALKPDDADYFIRRTGGGRLEGRLPAPGEPEAVVSEPLARNLQLKLGDSLLKPEVPEAFSPMPVKIVGILHTQEWKAIIPYEYHAQYHFPPIDSLLAFATDAKDQPTLDLWIEQHFKGQNARVFTYHKLEEQADTMFSILYQILNVVIGLLVIVITIMMGMLINIHLSQRVQEFGLLQALGYTKRALLGRVLAETSLVVAGGWIVGIGAAYLLLEAVKKGLMDPRAFALDTTDRLAYIYTLPVPVTIFLVVVITIGIKFKKFDPVGVVERRLV